MSERVFVRVKSESLEGIPEEIFVLAEDRDEARFVNRMNDVQAGIIKRERMEALLEKGVVHEHEKPDIRRAISNFMMMKRLSRVVRVYNPDGPCPSQ